MAIAEKRSYSVDLQKGAEHAVLRAPLATMDNQAHIFEVQVNEGGEAADLTAATCAGYFIRADGVTVALNGTVSGSTASVTLGANCYAVAGRFELAVKLTQGDVIHTILRVEGSVTTSRTDAMTGAGDAPGSGSDVDSEALAQLEQRVNTNAAAIDTLGGRVDTHEIAIGALQNEVDGLWDTMTPPIIQRDRVWNLLNNSDFRNPVNERGKTSYTGVGYAIDRWRSWVDSNTLTIHDGYITTTGDYSQYIKGLGEGTYSAFAMRTDGTLIQLNTGYESANDWRYVTLPAGSYVWAVLYEGEYSYNAEVLPAYVPKGYATELMECRRYYYEFDALVSSASSDIGAPRRMFVTLPIPMRQIPDVTYEVYGGNAPGNIMMQSNTTVDITAADQGYSHLRVRLSAEL